jgi:hypothetical protein
VGLESEFRRFLDAAQDIAAEAVKTHKAREHLRVTTGRVTSVDAANFRCNVRIANDTTDTTRLSYAKHLTTLAVNDYVWVLIQGPRPYGVIAVTNAVA